MRFRFLLPLLFATPVLAQDNRVKVEIEGVPLSECVQLLYREVLARPFVLSPEVYSDRRLTTIRIDADRATAQSDARRYLRALGYDTRDVDGVDQVKLRKEPRRVFVYRPRYRDVAYLTDQVRVMVSSTVASAGGIPVSDDERPAMGTQRPGTAAALFDRAADTFVYYGTEEEISRLQQVLPQLDTPVGEVDVRATVFEVTRQKSDGSAIQVAANVLSKRLGASIDWTPASAGGGTIKLSGGDFSAVVGALSQDTSFRTVSAPQVRAKSGTETAFTSGEQVPTLGQVSYAGQAGQPVQSVEYRDSGVLFKVRPTVRQGDVIDLALNQELSNFTATQNGVNGSPTLVKRSLTSTLSLRSGEVAVLAGLRQRKAGGGSRGILGIPLETTGEDTEVEVLLLLQVVRVPPPTAIRPPQMFSKPLPDLPVQQRRRRSSGPAPLITKG